MTANYTDFGDIISHYGWLSIFSFFADDQYVPRPAIRPFLATAVTYMLRCATKLATRRSFSNTASLLSGHNKVHQYAIISRTARLSKDVLVVQNQG